ncbi:C-type lectin domain family 2 member D3-like isoform X1 [Patagioenas fasciata]|uniref:C-type lectin domain family 2 member D3-like isoform X1 n=1 Tax=Patagioenas fasciata TaxID=372321 RepID=UPI003A99231E
MYCIIIVFSAIRQDKDNDCCHRTVSKLDWKEVLPSVMMPWTQDHASSQEELKEALGSQGEESIHQEMPDKWCTLHPVYVVVLAVLVALVLALAVAVAVLSAGRDGASAAAGLCCPDNWVGYRNVCYYLSREEGSWEWSQERCSSLGASLAVIKRKWEMEFLSHLRGNIDYWVGLRRQDGRPEWVDGSSFNDTFPLKGREPCFLLNDHYLWSSNCFRSHHYLCSKAQAVMSNS